MGRFEPAAGWSLSSSPNAARSLVNLEKPSFSDAGVFQGVQGGATDGGLAGEGSLGQLKGFCGAR